MYPPSPVPPWHRDAFYGAPETLTAAGTISLTKGTTILNSTTGGPHAIVLPNPSGDNCDLFEKEIFIPKANEDATAVFVVSGSFVGFDTLTFNNTGFSARLRYSGGAWHVIGGNALAN